MNNKEFKEELTKCSTSGKVSEELSEMFTVLIRHYIKRLGYENLSYVDEMVKFAHDDLCEIWQAFFISNTSDPYGFFTAKIRCAFSRFTKIKRQEEYNK